MRGQMMVKVYLLQECSFLDRKPNCQDDKNTLRIDFQGCIFCLSWADVNRLGSTGSPSRGYSDFLMFGFLEGFDIKCDL
jgi:hypothetical protein